jgi:anti-sigma B factor antagonist
MAAQLTIGERRAGDVTILDLTGRLVADEEDVLFTARIDTLLQAGRRYFVVNFERVTVIDSGGVGTLVAKYLSVRRHGGDIRLAHVTPRTRRVLEITRLLSVFATFDTDDEAVRSFAADHVSV